MDFMSSKFIWVNASLVRKRELVQFQQGTLGLACGFNSHLLPSGRSSIMVMQSPFAAVAQLAEPIVVCDKVDGSNPFGGVSVSCR